MRPPNLDELVSLLGLYAMYFLGIIVGVTSENREFAMKVATVGFILFFIPLLCISVKDCLRK